MPVSIRRDDQADGRRLRLSADETVLAATLVAGEGRPVHEPHIGTIPGERHDRRGSLLLVAEAVVLEGVAAHEPTTLSAHSGRAATRVIGGPPPQLAPSEFGARQDSSATASQPLSQVDSRLGGEVPRSRNSRHQRPSPAVGPVGPCFRPSQQRLDHRRREIVDQRQPVTFAAPPVNEVALALQFSEPVVDLDVLADFSRALRATFPDRQQQPPLPKMSEPVGLFSPPPLQIEFGLTSLPRTWLLSEDGHRLIQVQADRLVFNWRLLQGDQPYPRFVTLSSEFSDLVGALHAAATSAGRPRILVDFCEISYVNEIVVPGIEPKQRHPDLSEVISVVRKVKGKQFLPQAEDAVFQARWRIDPAALPPGSSVGRLYLAVSPGYRAETQLPIYAMNLSARIVPPPDTDLTSAMPLLDVGHDWIVRGFADITTKRMHRVWQIEEHLT